MLEVVDSSTNLFAPEHRSDPHPLYHRVRAAAPIWWNDYWEEWVITSHGPAETILRDPRFSTDPSHLSAPRTRGAGVDDMRGMLRDAGGQALLFLDPPDHTRLRRLVSQAFTPRAVERLRPRVQALVDELLDEVAGAGSMDVIADLGYPLPVTVICELLGVPLDDRHQFGAWSSDAARLLDGELEADVGMRGITAAMSLIAYFNELFEERRKAPRDDLVSALLAAEEAGDRLTTAELHSLVLLLFIAGHETTMNLIGNGTWALLRHPDQLRRLRDDPSLVANAVEEMLRWDGPVHVTGRIPTDDIEVEGVTLPKGQQCVVLLAAANRDPARFDEPDAFDVARADVHHLTFSQGIHYCLGAALARMEGQLALATLVARFPKLALDGDEPVYRDHLVLRGLKELRVSL